MKLYITYIVRILIETLFFQKEKREARKVSFQLSYKTSAQEICRFQDYRLKSLLSVAAKKATYYLNYSGKSIIEFPVVDKDILRLNEPEFVNSEFPSFKKIKFTTGGSTGEPFAFYVSRLSGLVDRYHAQAFYKKIGLKSGDRIFSFDGMLPSDEMISKNIYWKRTRYEELPYGSVHFSVMNLNEKTFQYYLSELNNSKPSYIRSYPSAIVDLAKFIEQSGTEIQFKLKGLVLSSENIYDWQIELLNRVFDAPVYGQYGHSEVCVFAYTEANSLVYKCSPYYGYTEVLNKEGKQVNVGEVGNIVVTGFYNEAMFFIRYDTGDMAEFGGYDENGYLIFNQILGREQEFIYNNESGSVNITALIFGQHYKAFEHIKKWRILQNEEGKVIILIIKDEKYTSDDESEIFRKFKEFGVDVTFEYTDQIPLSRRGKHQLVVQNIKK